MRGDLGEPAGGFPPKVRAVILKDRKPLKGRPGKRLKSIDFSDVRAEIRKRAKSGSDAIDDRDVLSYIMYPQVTLDYLDHRRQFGDVSILPTPNFFYGMQPGEEIKVEIEPGKTLYIKMIAVSVPDGEGKRTIFFELNGHPRDVKVEDVLETATLIRKPKADPENLHHLGAPMPGRIVTVLRRAGDEVQKGDPLFLIEAMKMETGVAATQSGLIETIHVSSGDVVDAGDLLLVFK